MITSIKYSIKKNKIRKEAGREGRKERRREGRKEGGKKGRREGGERGRGGRSRGGIEEVREAWIEGRKEKEGGKEEGKKKKRGGRVREDKKKEGRKGEQRDWKIREEKEGREGVVRGREKLCLLHSILIALYYYGTDCVDVFDGPCSEWVTLLHSHIISKHHKT